MTSADWAKAVAPILVAAITAFGTSVRLNQGDVGEDRFLRTGAGNCQDINDLKAGIRQVLRDLTGSEIDAAALGEALEVFQASDCTERVRE